MKFQMNTFLLYFVIIDCCLGSFILSFQSNGKLSTDEWAEYLEHVPEMREFTSCWWENLRYFSTDYTAVWGLCKQKTKRDQLIKCTQLYHR